MAIEHLDGTPIDLNIWGKVKVDDDTHLCMKYKKSDNGKLEDEDCSNSKPALCYIDCSEGIRN